MAATTASGGGVKTTTTSTTTTTTSTLLMMLSLLLLIFSTTVTVATIQDAAGGAAGASCRSDLDCQLNGACTSSNVCVCDKGWHGDDCGTLNLDPTPIVAYGYGASTSPNMSCWGGGPPVYDPATQKYHLLVSEIAGNCGMSTWARYSQSVRATADTLEGPYTRAATVVGTESHNTLYTYSAIDKTHLMYTIFEGTWPASCNTRLTTCTGGSTPGGKGLRPPPLPKNTCHGGPGGRPTIHWAKSLEGPWTSVGPAKVDWGKQGQPPNGGTSNPSPYIFPNGTTLLIARGQDARTVNGHRIVGHNIFLFRAPHWNATYEFIPLGGVNGSLPVGGLQHGPLTEDPVLYRGRRGFHILFHSSPDLTHAWSPDGFDWHWSPTVMGPPNHRAQGGGDNERPRVVVDENGDLEIVYVAQLLGTPKGAIGGDAARLAGFKTL